MKTNTKKLIAILLSAVMFFSAASVVAYAVDNTDYNVYFNPVGWKETDRIFCHIWELGGEEFFPWQSKSELCEKTENGLFAYNTNKLLNSANIEGGLDADKDYCIIFSSGEGAQTYDVTFGTRCIGDKLTVEDGNYAENPVDSEKKSCLAYWDARFEEYGPHFAITSIGNITEGLLCPHESKAEVIGNWLMTYFNSEYADPVAALKKACDYLHLKTVSDCRAISDYISSKRPLAKDELAMFRILKQVFDITEASPDEPISPFPYPLPDEVEPTTSPVEPTEAATTTEPSPVPTTTEAPITTEAPTATEAPATTEAPTAAPTEEATQATTEKETSAPAITPPKKSKKANTIKVSAKVKTVKAKKLKKKALTVSVITVKNAKGAVSYKKLSGSKKLSVTKTGAVKIKRATKKGTYKITVQVTAKGNANFKAASKKVKVTIKVK